MTPKQTASNRPILRAAKRLYNIPIAKRCAQLANDAADVPGGDEAIRVYLAGMMLPSTLAEIEARIDAFATTATTVLA